MLFRGPYWFLSNFCLIDVMYNGVVYSCVETAFQAQKALLANDMEAYSAICASTPAEAKKLGRRVKLTKNQVIWWDSNSICIMTELLRSKFKNPEIRSALLSTGDTPIVEDNTWGDTYWGMCNGRGNNHLGKIIMEIREEIKDGRVV